MEFYSNGKLVPSAGNKIETDISENENHDQINAEELKAYMEVEN